jgi:hypothetical protein
MDNTAKTNRSVSLPIASALVPDGYFGDTQQVEIALLDKGTGSLRIVCLPVNGKGSYYSAPAPEVQDKAEAEWILVNHPACRHYFSALSLIR